MKLDTTLLARNLREAAPASEAAEAAGFDAIWTAEAGSDAFLPAALVAEHTKRVKIRKASAPPRERPTCWSATAPNGSG